MFIQDILYKGSRLVSDLWLAPWLTNQGQSEICGIPRAGYPACSTAPPLHPSLCLSNLTSKHNYCKAIEINANDFYPKMFLT